MVSPNSSLVSSSILSSTPLVLCVPYLQTYTRILISLIHDVVQVEWQVHKVEEKASVAQIESYRWIYYEICEAEDMVVEHNCDHFVEYLSIVMTEMFHRFNQANENHLEDWCHDKYKKLSNKDPSEHHHCESKQDSPDVEEYWEAYDAIFH